MTCGKLILVWAIWTVTANTLLQNLPNDLPAPLSRIGESFAAMLRQELR